jgi:hypothetical protein
VDQPVLKPLPVTPYEFALWKKAKISIDYPVEYIAKTPPVCPAHVGNLIYNPHTSSASLLPGRHQSESVADFIGMR